MGETQEQPRPQPPRRSVACSWAQIRLEGSLPASRLGLPLLETPKSSFCRSPTPVRLGCPGCCDLPLWLWEWEQREGQGGTHATRSTSCHFSFQQTPH